VIADRFALYANQVFNNVHAYNGFPLVIAIYAYAFQIFFDFSGYTDMARGTARIFGINLTENFNSPYLATSIADFWRRWHISFSRWILDYIFKPLQMGCRDWKQTGTAIALIITFLVSGIWHGASWGFVLWGLLHGIYLASSTYYRPYQKKLHAWLGVKKGRLLQAWQVFVTFNLVSVAWIFFRSDSLGDALYIVKNIVSLDYLSMIRTDGFQRFFKYNVLLGLGEKTLWPLLVSILIFGVFYRYFENENRITSLYARWLIYISLLLICMNMGVSAESKFLYLQF
jgi:D-alanyl-lipoteichoic acid acyltransferase DltB (MBOAT superfamily)